MKYTHTPGPYKYLSVLLKVNKVCKKWLHIFQTLDLHTQDDLVTLYIVHLNLLASNISYRKLNVIK